MVQARAIVEDERVSDLELTERNNLDEEMQAMVDGVVKKYGFMPNSVKLFATDNERLRAVMVPRIWS